MTDLLLGLFTQTLLPTEARSAEDQLRNIQHNAGFLDNLVLLLYKKECPIAPRIAAAIYLKNMIKTQWRLEESVFKENKENIRRNIITAAVQTEQQIKAHVIEAASLIARYDFPHDWNVLMKVLTSLIDDGSTDVCVSGMKIACAVFEKYQQESRSDELFTEINLVMAQFSPSLLLLCRKTYAEIGKKGVKKELIELMCLITETFYSLSAQDLPEYFEDHITDFMSVFIGCFQFRTFDSTEGVTLLLKNIVDIARLYASKYIEEFVGVGEFIEIALKTLFTLSIEPKDDGLFISSIKFISAVSSQEAVFPFFTEKLLAEICERIVLPNIQLRESDLEMFEDEPLDFLRSDLEGTALETRRYVTGDLLRVLLAFHREFLFVPLERMIVSFLNEYQQSPIENWKAKDTVFYLLICVSFKGEANSKTKETGLVSIPTFFSQHVAQDLQPTNDAFHPLIKLNAMRFLVSFKRLLAKEQLLQGLQSLKHHLESSNIAVFTYAAIAIENILALKRNGFFVIEIEEKTGHVQDIEQKLLFLIKRKKSVRKMCENEFIPKALFHILKVGCEDSLDIPCNILSELCFVLNLTMEEPTFPAFNYFVFESIGLLIKKEKKVESQLSLLIQKILQNGVSEFTPYVFQVFSYLLEENVYDTAVTELSNSVFLSLLNRSTWQEMELVPFLCRFLCAYITRNQQKIVECGWTGSILGIFKFFIGIRNDEQIGVNIATSFVSEMEKAVVEENLKDILLVFLNKIQTNKTKRLGLGFRLFLCVFLTRNAFENRLSFLSATLENIQQGLFLMVVNSFVIENSFGIFKEVETQIAMNAISLLVCEYPLSPEIKFKALRTCLQMMQNKQNPVLSEREHGQTSFNLRSISKQKEYNVSLASEKTVLCSILKKASEDNQEKFNHFVQQELSINEKTYLANLTQ